MDIEQFKPKINQPTKEHFTRIYFYDQGKCVAAPAIPEEVELARKHNPNAVVQKCFDADTYKKAKLQYNEHVAHLREKFKVALLEDFNVPADRFGNALYDLACRNAQDGDGDTLENIEHEFCEVAYLYSEAQNNFKG